MNHVLAEFNAAHRARQARFYPSRRVAMLPSPPPAILAQPIVEPVLPMIVYRRPILTEQIDAHVRAYRRHNAGFVRRAPAVSLIIAASARAYSVKPELILSARRTAKIVRPRQVAMYLVRLLTPLGLPEIGRNFGGRDHTTVMHAVRKMEKLASDPQVAEKINIIRADIAANFCAVAS